MQKALNSLPSMREVNVERSSKNAKNGYAWSITFLSDVPFEDSKQLTVDKSGLEASGALVTVTVGTNLAATPMPGGLATTTATVTQNSKTITAANGHGIVNGDWVKIASSQHTNGEVFTAQAVAGNSITLSSPYLGTSGSAKTVWRGSTVPGSLPTNLKSHVVDDVSDGPPFSYTITGLLPGVNYYARISSYNDRGYSAPRSSNPLQVAPPKQKPDVATQVGMIVNTASSLKVLWNHPLSDGGDTITKYKIEWDTKASFDSHVSGTALGMHDLQLATPSTDCKLTPCEYVVSSLTKGTPYYVRVYAYNTYGYSVKAAIPTPSVETPKSQPKPPSVVNLTPASQNSLMVNFPASADDGGGAVTKYKIEWDALGHEGYLAHTQTNGVHNAAASAACLYQHHEVQTITVYATEFNLGGSFRVAYKSHATPALLYSISAEGLRSALEALPTVGSVHVTRAKHLTLASGTQDMTQNGFVWTVSFLTNSGDLNRIGDVDNLVVSTHATDLPSSFASSATANMLVGTNAKVVVVPTVQGYAGFEQQTITTSTSAGTLGGTFTLTFEGLSTPSLPFNVSAAVMKQRLEALGNMGVLEVTRRIFNSGHMWTVVFKTLLGNVPSITASKLGLTSTDPSATIGLDVNDTIVGSRPPMSSSLYGFVELSGASISGSTISHEIPSLVQGAHYHVRVSAFNGVGDAYGHTQYSTPATEAPAKLPDAPV